MKYQDIPKIYWKALQFAIGFLVATILLTIVVPAMISAANTPLVILGFVIFLTCILGTIFLALRVIMDAWKTDKQ